MRMRGLKGIKPLKSGEGLAFEEFLAAAEEVSVQLPGTSTSADQLAVRSEEPARGESANEEPSEEEIGQTAFTIFSWLHYLAASACRASRSIKPEHVPTLEALERHPGVNLTHLAKNLGVNVSTVDSQAKILNKNGILVLHRKPLKKGRAVVAAIEEPGREQISRLRAKVGSEIKEGLGSGNGQREDLIRALERLLAVMKVGGRA